ncbi:MAG: thioredoxin domain-containing protein [Methanoregula sp.]|nr:thioredoxin domain-containing protein [Methanoregula sp.]
MSFRSVMNQNPPNHLIREKSPYLQQHAFNPVDWYPWGDEPFRRAAKEDKPVFLSIGYSTCHWCHVMAHESFEDPGIADLLNAHYIAIKVDREERPDIDSIYMTACQQMTGQGGWPLTLLLTPDKKPFFAGTYLPRKTRPGLTGLSELLQKVIRIWQEQRGSLVTAAEQFTARLADASAVSPAGNADQSLIRGGYEELVALFDPVNGGFGRAPKFPTPSTLLFLLRYWKRTGSGQALGMVEMTLGAMRCGGIHDHLGGGFHRYSTDPQWYVPHFEKMLYDQALLLTAFTEAWLATKKPIYRTTAEGIITYVTRDLSSPEGAFMAAEDADSAGGEGAFYLWTRKELDAVLGPRDGPYAATFFGVEEEGNFFSTVAGGGKNILKLKIGDIDNKHDPARIASIRNKLLAERAKRPRPKRDDKILTDWNALMIAALALASRAFGDPEYYRTAETAMRFILDRMRLADGGLLHRYCDGEAAIPAFADDYAFIIRALIELYETSFNSSWLEEAVVLNHYLNRHFSDTRGEGFFTVSDDGETLIATKKEIYDGAIPSGNSMMLGNLVLLSHLTGDPEYEEQASRVAEWFSGIVSRSPSSYSQYLCGLDHLLGPASDVVIAAEESDPVAKEMIRIVCDTYIPSVTVHFRRSSQADAALDALAPFTRAMTTENGKATAYVCSGRTCSPPVTTPDALRQTLGKKVEGAIRGS